MNQNEIMQAATINQGISCPNCNNHDYIKNGTRKGIQRYKCKSCKRAFSDTTNTPLHRMHKKHLANSYFRNLEEGLSIRKAAKKTGIAVSTAFYWRHRFLSSLQDNIPITLSKKTISFRITSTKTSYKGKRGKIDKHTKHTHSLIISNGYNPIKIAKLETSKISHQIIKLLRSVMNEGDMIIPEKTAKARKIMNRYGQQFTECKNNSQSSTSKTINDSTTSEMEIWIDKFRGVATKYLQHYWNWYLFSQNGNTQPTKTLDFCNQRTYLDYRSIKSA